MRTRSKLQLAALVLALLSLVSMTGCAPATPGQLETYISIAVKAGSAVISILASTGVVSPQVQTYAIQGEQWLAFVTTELATADSDAIKVMKITQNFAQIISPDLTNAPTAVIITVLAFSAGLSAVLGAIQGMQLKPSPAPAGNVMGMKSTHPALETHYITPTPDQLLKLQSLNKNALDIAAKAEKGK